MHGPSIPGRSGQHGFLALLSGPRRRRRGPTRRRRRAAWIVGTLATVALGVSAMLDSATRGRADTVTSPVRQIGVLSTLVDNSNAQGAPSPPPLVVDSVHHLGFTIGETPGNQHSTLLIYDLVQLAPVGLFDLTTTGLFTRVNLANIVVDPSRQQLDSFPGPSATASLCQASLGATVTILDYSQIGSDGKRIVSVKSRPLPCSGPQEVSPDTATYDAAHDRFIIAGQPAQDARREIGRAFGDTGSDGQSLFVGALNPSTWTFDWVVDLTKYGCTAWQQGAPYAERVGDTVLAYCYDTHVIAFPVVGQYQGYAVTIPLADGMPVVSSTYSLGGTALPVAGTSLVTDPAGGGILNATVYRTPAIPGDYSVAGDVVPMADPGSGQLLLASNNPYDGQAVWIFDPTSQRFVGAISGGVASPPPGDSAAGIDRARGIAYVVSAAGLLVAPVRETPLGGGALYADIAANPSRESYPLLGAAGSNAYGAPPVAVDPGLHRLFIPVKDEHGWVVVQDDTVIAPPPPVSPPDDNTSQVDDPAHTVATVSGIASAQGARLLVVGGLTKPVMQADPLCDDPQPRGVEGLADPPLERRVNNNQCLIETLISTGDRDLGIAQTAVDTGSNSGATADAAGLAFAPSDTADPADMRTYHVPSQVAAPLAAADCSDGGGSPASQGSPSLQSGAPSAAVTSSAVSCDATATDGTTPTATATSSTNGATLLAVPASANGGTPVSISVAGTSSHIASQLTAAGQKTTVTAIANGVVIGPVTVAQIVSSATTVARGHAGTAKLAFSRQWCGVLVPGQAPIPQCFDPADPASPHAGTVAAINHQLGKVQVQAPAAEQLATPGGYESVVDKDPGVRAADEAVDDDFSPAVPGMQVIVYNDGFEGRSRTIVQLANVHTEAREAITPIPDYGGGTLLGGGAVPGTATKGGHHAAPAVRPPAVGASGSADSALNVVSGASGVPVVRTIIIDGGAAGGSGGTGSGRAPAVTAPSNPLQRILDAPGTVARDVLNLIVEDPAEFGFLVALWALLATPVYLAVRRRARARALSG